MCLNMKLEDVQIFFKLTVASGAGQTAQHSPNGISGLGQSRFSSSHITSSQRTNPPSQMQIWHGSGFQTSLSA